MHNECTWDERYRAGKDALPWDSGVQAPELEQYFSTLDKMPASVLEIGCGTGTNAIWMAQKGCKVIATDLSPAAIDAANQKQKGAGTNVEFQVSDIIEKNPVKAGSVDFVFDRGVYHVMTPELRRVFIDRVVEALNENGFWLCLAGNADEHRGENEEGPPQLKLSELVVDAEKAARKFTEWTVRLSCFLMGHRNWRGLCCTRSALR